MLEKIYGLVDFTAAFFLLFGGISAPAIVLQICAIVLVLKGALSFVPIPIYMPSLLMCGADILAALLLAFSSIGFAAKSIIIFVLLFKAFPGLIFSLLGK